MTNFGVGLVSDNILSNQSEKSNHFYKQNITELQKKCLKDINNYNYLGLNIIRITGMGNLHQSSYLHLDEILWGHGDLQVCW